jgi:hypothetical protein
VAAFGKGAAADGKASQAVTNAKIFDGVKRTPLLQSGVRKLELSARA